MSSLFHSMILRQGKVFLDPDSLAVFRDLGFLNIGLTSKDWKKEGIENSRLLHTFWYNTYTVIRALSL